MTNTATETRLRNAVDDVAWSMIVPLLDELDSLRRERDVLLAEVKVAREYNKLRNAKRGTGVLQDWQKRLSAARLATDAIGGKP